MRSPDRGGVISPCHRGANGSAARPGPTAAGAKTTSPAGPQTSADKQPKADIIDEEFGDGAFGLVLARALPAPWNSTVSWSCWAGRRDRAWRPSWCRLGGGARLRESRGGADWLVRPSKSLRGGCDVGRRRDPRLRSDGPSGRSGGRGTAAAGACGAGAAQGPAGRGRRAAGERGSGAGDRRPGGRGVG